MMSTIGSCKSACCPTHHFHIEMFHFFLSPDKFIKQFHTSKRPEHPLEQLTHPINFSCRPSYVEGTEWPSAIESY